MTRRSGRPARSSEGALRATILDVTLDLLGQSGNSDAVTVAMVVAASGCTPPSLYHYWPSREALLVEASQLGWARFREHQAAATAGEADPIQRIRRRGVAYLAFALDQPVLFRVLFLSAGGAGRRPGTSIRGPEADRAASSKEPADPGDGLLALEADAAQAVAAGLIASRPARQIATLLWAAAHGIAALSVTSTALTEDQARAQLDSITDVVLSGLGYVDARGT